MGSGEAAAPCPRRSCSRRVSATLSAGRPLCISAKDPRPVPKSENPCLTAECFGASIVAQNVIMAAAKFIPIAGWLVSVSMAYALTFAIAEVSDHYFSTGRGADTEELKSLFKKVYKDKKAEKQRKHKGNDSLADKLDQLKQARKADLLSDEEFEKKKEEILAKF